MKASYILFLALLGVSALSLASAHNGLGADSRPPVVIRTNETGIVTLNAVNSALNQTWGKIRRSWSKGNKTLPRPPVMAPLAAFLDVDAKWISAKKGVNVTLLDATAFQVTLTGKAKINPMVAYLASTTNGTNVTGIVTVILPKSSWIKAASAEDEEEVAAASFSNKDKNSTKPEWEKPEWEKNITKPDWPTHNITKPDWPSKNWTKPAPQPKPFAAMVKKSLAANETTTTVTVADINGVAAPGGANIPKIASFSSKPNLATISSAAASKWSWATVDFNATASATSFTVTLPASYKKPVAWVVVSVTGTSTSNTTTQGTVSVKITRAKSWKN